MNRPTILGSSPIRLAPRLQVLNRTGMSNLVFVGFSQFLLESDEDYIHINHVAQKLSLLMIYASISLNNWKVK
jgi:hypothetical protein